jgi:hypothetical protein
MKKLGEHTNPMTKKFSLCPPKSGAGRRLFIFDLEPSADRVIETFAAAASARILLKLTNMRISQYPFMLFLISGWVAKEVVPDRFWAVRSKHQKHPSCGRLLRT